uniref:Uncharacterized protein n=1 Tax=Arundo donax TaxID=35708 RepID=A0A0A8ZHE4_ARUDO
MPVKYLLKECSFRQKKFYNFTFVHMRTMMFSTQFSQLHEHR